MIIIIKLTSVSVIFNALIFFNVQKIRFWIATCINDYRYCIFYVVFSHFSFEIGNLKINYIFIQKTDWIINVYVIFTTLILLQKCLFSIIFLLLIFILNFMIMVLKIKFASKHAFDAGLWIFYYLNDQRFNKISSSRSIILFILMYLFCQTFNDFLIKMIFWLVTK